MLAELRKAFGHVKYFDEPHIYIDTRTGHQLTSVTTWLKQFSQEFDTQYWSNYKANQRGITQEEILREWEMARVYGQLRGTRVHLLAEHLSNNKEFVYPIPVEIVQMDLVEKFNTEIGLLKPQIEAFIENENFTVIKNELILANHSIAGQCDLLAEKDGRIILYDFKTDLSIDFTTKYGTLKKPFQDLPATNFSKYTLQLSTYKRLLETATSIKVDEMYIVHFNVKNDSYKMYKINDYKWHQ